MAERTEEARQLAVRAARQVDFDGRGARVYRVSSAVLVELPEADVVARVESPDRRHSAIRQVRAARFFEARDAPVVRLAHPEPLAFDQGVVTLWQRLHPVERRLGFGELGRLLKVLHDRAGRAMDPDLLPFEPFDYIDRDLSRPAMDVGEHRLRALWRRFNALRVRWADCVQRAPSDHVLVHGDVHEHNVVVTTGGPRFVDLELAGVGPAGWDLAALTVGSRRYGLAEAQLEAFFAGYGEDPRGQDPFELFCQTYELFAVAWTVHCASASPRILREARMRVSTLLGESNHTWTIM